MQLPEPLHTAERAALPVTHRCLPSEPWLAGQPFGVQQITANYSLATAILNSLLTLIHEINIMKLRYVLLSSSVDAVTLIGCSGDSGYTEFRCSYNEMGGENV